jgi:tetratricopeptide (TPR) repeat protein
MAKDSLLLDTTKGGGVGLQTSVVNVLAMLRNTSIAIKDTTLADSFKAVILNSSFDVSKYITDTKALVSKTENADAAAWYCAGLANIAKINMEASTGKVDIATVKGIVSEISNWLSDKNHLLDMRNMGWQNWLYESLAALTKQIYAKGSSVGTDATLEGNLTAIFGTITTLKDSLVKENALAALKTTTTAMRENGFKDQANKFDLAVCTTSEAMATKAWDLYNAKDYASAKVFADEIIAKFSADAVTQQASLHDYAPKGSESKYWALNDVATAHFILGKSYKDQKDTAKAKEQFQKIISAYGYAQCYDPKNGGSYWKVKEAAEKELKTL